MHQAGVQYRDARQELAALGLAVVGLSPDLPARQKKFDDKYNLSFPLLTDPDHAVAEACRIISAYRI